MNPSTYKNEGILDQSIMAQAARTLAYDPDAERAPDYWVYVFNTSQSEVTRYRPSVAPKILLRACELGKPYEMVARFPNAIRIKHVNFDSGQVTYSSMRGERFCTDLLNPANLSDDCWIQINPNAQGLVGAGDDMVQRGFFWSRNEVPTAQELAKSKQRKEAFYRTLIEDAERRHRLLPSGKEPAIGSQEECHLAAEYFGRSFAWHDTTSAPATCPSCGESVKEGAAYHASSLGGICVISWERTVAAGMKGRDQVPSEMRWWKEGKDESKRDGGRS